MNENQNPQVVRLLRWHGHQSGGVRVPFQEGTGNPLRDARRIKTDVLNKIGTLVENLARGEACPRWIFLIGGPGNGKSEAIEEFLGALDEKLSCGGELKKLLKEKYSGTSGLSWGIDVVASQEPQLGQNFQEKIGQLIVIQDASVSTEPDRDAAQHLNTYLLELLTHPATTKPVFLCCMNRGLLARAIKNAAASSDYERELRPIFIELSKATGLTSKAFSGRDTPCWPLQGEPPLKPEGQFACWPLDMQSLLLEVEENEPEQNAFEQMLAEAVDEEEWEVASRCTDCASGDVCPFRQNARWLRGPDGHTPALTKLLRRVELVTSLRWTFRTMFSLVAEVLVGEWEDFSERKHPCEWVHAQRRAGTFSARWKMLRRLYPYALFPLIKTLFDDAARTSVSSAKQPTSGQVFRVLDDKTEEPTTAIRRFLVERVSKILDPAKLSEPSSPMHGLEEEYSQSVHQGNEAFVGGSGLEAQVLGDLDIAEREWDEFSRDSVQSARAVRALRVVAATLAKRSVGVRMGWHGEHSTVEEYEKALRNEALLNALLDRLRDFLGAEKFSTDALATLGQPRDEAERLVTLRGSSLPIRPIRPAPKATAERPAHDFPVVSIEGKSLPVTFELFRALKMKELGCLTASLPASVRAALESIATLYAGKLCRATEDFETKRTRLLLEKHGEVTISPESNAPIYKERQR